MREREEWRLAYLEARSSLRINSCTHHAIETRGLAMVSFQMREIIACRMEPLRAELAWRHVQVIGSDQGQTTLPFIVGHVRSQ